VSIELEKKYMPKLKSSKQSVLPMITINNVFLLFSGKNPLSNKRIKAKKINRKQIDINIIRNNY
tara:strand:- start:368 stop:559 length:192 start_codon:yes stop_codon:yes gene_type:complete